jgi:lysophospholipase L1-like esterase
MSPDPIQPDAESELENESLALDHLKPDLKSKGSNSRARRWVFRLGAVALGLSVFAAAELLCMVFGWGEARPMDDPFVGFSDIHPLFELDAQKSRYQIAQSRRKFFAHDSFPAVKKPDTFRIFCLGGSTVQGRPFSIDTSFTRWLELSLNAGDTSRNWQVINAGGISYASYRLVPILQQCLEFEPDMLVICTGHNEFLEQRTYGDIKDGARYLDTLQYGASRLRTYTLLRQLIGGQTSPVAPDTPVGPNARSPKRSLLGPETEPLLDFNRGLEAYHRDEDFRAGVIQHYEFNLRRMIAIAKRAGVPVMLIRPPSNLKDSPPFKSQHRAGLTDDQSAQWKKLMGQARTELAQDPQQACELLKQALAIDDQYAMVHYQLGKCYEAMGQVGLARESFWLARENDICPLRMLEPMEKALAEVAAQTDTPLIDAHALLEKQSPIGILGDQMLVDHIHPSFKSHRAIADALAARMDSQGLFLPSLGWSDRRQMAYDKQLGSLDDRYFLKGRRMLRGLRAWAQGRADGPPIEQKLNP